MNEKSPLQLKLAEIDQTLSALIAEVTDLRNNFSVLQKEIKDKQQRMRNEKESE